MLPSFERTIFAFADTTVRQAPQGLNCSGDGTEAVAHFLIAVHKRMPDYLRLPFHILVLIFDAWPILFTGKPFHRLDLDRRAMQLSAWKNSRLEMRRRLIEFYGSLALFGLYSELYGEDYHYD